MSHSVLALVHGAAPTAAPAMLGSLERAFTRCGHDVGLASFTDPERWPRPRLDGARMVLVLGSPGSAADAALPWLDVESRFVCTAVRRDIPVLGIGFGAHLLNLVLGGRVVVDGAPERGLVPVRSSDPNRVPDGVWYAHHRDGIVPLPEATVVAQNDSCVQAFAYGPHLGVQFHPEATPGTVDAWRHSFTGTRSSLEAEVPSWRTDREALHRAGPDLAGRTATLVRNFVRTAQRHLAEAV